MSLPLGSPPRYFTLPARRDEYDDGRPQPPRKLSTPQDLPPLKLPRNYDTALVRATEFAERARSNHAPYYNTTSRRLERAETQHLAETYGNERLDLETTVALTKKSPYVPRYFDYIVNGAFARTDEEAFQCADALMVVMQNRIVDNGGDDATYAELAQHLVWLGTAWVSPQRCALVAGFAKLLEIAFADQSVPNLNHLAPQYAQAVRDCAMTTFEKWWDSDDEHSVMNKTWDPIAHVTEALAAAILVGDMYNKELLSAADVRRCLDILVWDGIPTLDHVHAAHLLIQHAGNRFVRSKDTARYLNAWKDDFSMRARRVAARSTMLGQEFTTAELHEWVNAIVKLINLWAPSALVFEDNHFCDVNLELRVAEFLRLSAARNASYSNSSSPDVSSS